MIFRLIDLRSPSLQHRHTYDAEAVALARADTRLPMIKLIKFNHLNYTINDTIWGINNTLKLTFYIKYKQKVEIEATLT